jgi:TolA-binding protein
MQGLRAKAHWSVFGLMFGLGMGFLSAAWGAVDEVTLVNGKPIKGEVIKETVASVKMVDERKAQLPEFTGAQVASIKWDIQNLEFQQAEKQLEGGNYEGAAVGFKGVVDDFANFPREPAKPYVMLQYGTSLYQAGKPEDAQEAFEKLMTDYSTSRYVGDAAGRLISIYIQLKNFNRAKELLKKLSGMGANFAARALLLEADIDLAQGKKADASGKYAKVPGSTTDAELLALARLGQARCEEQPAKMRQAAEAALALKGASPNILATAHLLIGNSLLEEGKALKDDAAKEKLLDAVLEFLRVTMLYPGNETTEGEAMFKAGECFKLLSKRPDRKADRGRAAELYRQVREKYPGSRWAKVASESLKEIQ